MTFVAPIYFWTKPLLSILLTLPNYGETEFTLSNVNKNWCNGCVFRDNISEYTTNI